ncbi:MAG: glycosyltransferase [Thermoplasmata archaeon]
MNRKDDKRFCDIIIPVYKSLNYTVDCIESVLRYTDYPYRLLIIDDGNEFYVAQKLNQYENKYGHIKVFRNEENIGYVKSINRGLRESTGKYVILLNSDTFVTPGWLSRMIKCAESDPKIAIVNPITNMAANLSVQIPPGLNIFTMDKVISQISKKNYPCIITAVGFCLLIKKNIVDQCGGFDEVYGKGYCEESDFCMRVMENGYRVVAADDVFVYHKGCASFENSQERYLTNRKIFDCRWEELYLKEYKKFLQENPLSYIRNHLNKNLILFDPELNPIRNLWVMTRDVFKRKGLKGVIEKIPKVPIRVFSSSKKVIRELNSTHNQHENPLKKQTCWVTKKYISNLPEGNGIKVAFLIYQMGMSGGILQVIYIVNELIKNGHTAYIVTLSEDPEPSIFNLYTRPLRFKNIKEMARYFPEVDLIVSTFWPTAYYWVPKLKHKNQNSIYLYFIQDIESRFYPKDNMDIKRKINKSYSHVDFRIATTQWIKDELIKLGYISQKIPVGIDLNAFYPRDRIKTKRGKRIIIQARPNDIQRGFDQALEVFKLISKEQKDIEFIFYGCREEDLKPYYIPFQYKNMGIIYDANKVGELFCSCDLFIDSSLFQGFGMTGLEAMACGVPTVLTKEGGITEYAVNEVNTLLIDPKNTTEMKEAIMKVLSNEDLRCKLIRNGLETAKKFSHEEKAKEHIEYYKTILQKKSQKMNSVNKTNPN